MTVAGRPVTPIYKREKSLLCCERPTSEMHISERNAVTGKNNFHSLNKKTLTSLFVSYLDIKIVPQLQSRNIIFEIMFRFLVKSLFIFQEAGLRDWGTFYDHLGSSQPTLEGPKYLHTQQQITKYILTLISKILLNKTLSNLHRNVCDYNCF